MTVGSLDGASDTLRWDPRRSWKLKPSFSGVPFRGVADIAGQARHSGSRSSGRLDVKKAGVDNYIYIYKSNSPHCVSLSGYPSISKFIMAEKKLRLAIVYVLPSLLGSTTNG